MSILPSNYSFLGVKTGEKLDWKVLQEGFLMMQDWISGLGMVSYACLVRLKSENGWIVFFSQTF